jgi:hypothetical protein
VKIAMISVRDHDAAGQRLRVAELSEALVRLGHEATVYTRQVDRRTSRPVRIDRGVEVVHVPAGPPRELGQDDVVPHLGEFARFLTARWAGEAPDVVHAHHWTSGLAAVLGARRIGVPIVQSYHGLEGGDSAGIERLIGREAAPVIATSGHGRGRSPGSACAVPRSRWSPGAWTRGCSR